MSSRKVSLLPKLMAFMLISFFSAFLFAAPVSAIDTGESASGATLYSDLNASNPNFNHIKYLSQKGIITGYPDGSFQPESSLSRAEAAALLARTMGFASSSLGEGIFRDVGAGHWAAPYIASCVRAGYIKGYPDGSFGPEEKLSRAQGISLVLRLSKQDMDKAPLPQIEDLSHEHWAAPYIATGLDAGIVGLDSSAKRFFPDSPFSRQEMCRALGMLLTQDPDYYNSELKAKLIVEKGEVTLSRDGQSRKVEKSESIIIGDIIESGPAATALINYPDGSSILIKENSLISISDSRGRNYISKMGESNVAVDWLNFRIEKGLVYTALATRDPETPSGAEGSQSADLTTLLATASDSSRYIAAAEKDIPPPWYKTAEQKKVKIKVDMPYGILGVRGTFIMINVDSDGQCEVSCLTGNAELSSPGGAVSISAGQSSAITQQGAAPQPPASMSLQQQQQFQQVLYWVEQTQQQIEQSRESIVSPPPPAGSPAGQQQLQQRLQQQQQQEREQQSQQLSDAGDSGYGGGGGDSCSDGTAVSINHVENITATIIQGQSYRPPATVPAVMSNGTSSEVPVNWNDISPDTSQAGVITLKGTIAGYCTTLTLTLNVESTSLIASIDDLQEILEQNQSYELPATVTAILEDGNSRQVQVSWEVQDVDTSEPCIVNINGSVEGYSGTVKLTLDIKEKVISIKQIEDIRESIETGGSYELPAQLTAIMSDDSSKLLEVSWEPSSVDTSVPGTYSFIGTVAGYSPLVNLLLTVDDSTLPQAAAPLADPPAGEYSTAQSVTLSSLTDAATIYYTTDGSDPRDSESRKEFSEAIVIAGDTTIKAYAIKEGMADSAVESFSYRFTVTAFKLEALFVNNTLVGGDSFNTNLHFYFNDLPDLASVLGIPGLDQGATIFSSSAFLDENNNLSFANLGLGSFANDFRLSAYEQEDLDGNASLIADKKLLAVNIFGVASGGIDALPAGLFTPDSNLKTAGGVSIDCEALQPTITQIHEPVLKGSYSEVPTRVSGSTLSNQPISEVRLGIRQFGSDGEGDSWRFGEEPYLISATPDGSADNPWSEWHLDLNQDQRAAFLTADGNKPFNIDVIVILSDTSIRTISMNVGYFHIDIAEDQAAAPLADPAAGEYSTAQSVTLSSLTDAATIYYTTDGSDPRDSESRKEFSEAIVIAGDTTIRAYAIKEGMADSELIDFEYIIAKSSPGAYVCTVSPDALYEDSDNNGGLASHYEFDYPVVVVKIADGALQADEYGVLSIKVEDITAYNLPEGLYVDNVYALDLTMLYIELRGEAINHAREDSIDNLYFTINKEVVDGAAEDLITAPVSIIFDPDFAYVGRIYPSLLYIYREDDGSSQSSEITIEISNAAVKEEVLGNPELNPINAHNLPEGLNLCIVDFKNQSSDKCYIEIKISGQDAEQDSEISIDDLYFTISKEALDGADADLSTGNISIRII